MGQKVTEYSSCHNSLYYLNTLELQTWTRTSRRIYIHICGAIQVFCFNSQKSARVQEKNRSISKKVGEKKKKKVEY